MKKTIIIAFHLVLIAVGWFILTYMFFDAMPSWAQDSSSPCTAGTCQIGQQSRHHGGMFRLIMEELNLTDEQRTQIRSIIAGERTNMQPLVQQLKAARTELRTITANGTFNEDQVRALANQQAGTMADLMVVRQRVKSKVMAVLTPDQQTEAQKMLDLLLKSHKRGRLPQAG
jgi:periplasmic protein CpxP/Spy